MSERIPNFVYGAIYRAKSRYPSASARASTASLLAMTFLPRLMSPIVAFVMPSVVIDPGLNVWPVPVQKEDFARIINILQKGQRM